MAKDMHDNAHGLALSIDAKVGARVRRRREQQKISQTALGEAIGISFQQVQKYERGTNRISASALFMIGKALEIGPEYFFEGLGGDTPTEDTAAADLVEAARALSSAAEGLLQHAQSPTVFRRECAKGDGCDDQLDSVCTAILSLHKAAGQPSTTAALAAAAERFYRRED